MEENEKKHCDDRITKLETQICELEAKLKEQEKFNESEEQFRVISETSPQAIMIYQNDKWVYANKAAREISGYSAQELKEMHFWEFVHPDYQKLVKEMGTKRQSNIKAEKNYDFKIITKSGKEKWVWLNGSRTIYHGKPAGIISVQDATKRKEAENKLKENEERFKFLTKATFEGIVVHNKGIIVDANDSFLKMTGYNRQEVLRQNLLDYIPLMKDKAKILVNIVKHTAKPYLITARHKDGSFFTVELEAKDVKQNGKIVRIAAVRDVTEREESRKQLQAAHQRLEIMNSILRHDISNELGVIDSAMEIYSETGNEEMLEEVRKRVNKCIHTIREQHTLANELKKKRSGKRDFKLTEIFELLLRNYPELKIDYTGNASVMADAAIFSVFDNLISNSLKHGNASEIRFIVNENDEYTIISFQDNGSGIPDELKKSVFKEGFFAGKTGNTGIGLHIVNKTMKNYGGKIELSDNVPHGVIFDLYFPRIKFKNS